MPRLFPLRLGCAYSFHYPRHNYVGLPARTETRRIVVEALRDIDCEPLEASTVASNPQLRRGRWLVTGFDLDRDASRSFYFDSMTEVRSMTRDETQPLLGAEFVVLTSAGRAHFQTSRLGDAIDFLLSQPAGVLCKIVSCIEDPRFATADDIRPA